MFFSVITKNLNWEILTGMGLKMKILILWGFTENPILRKGGYSRKTDI